MYVYELYGAGADIFSCLQALHEAKLIPNGWLQQLHGAGKNNDLPAHCAVCIVRNEECCILRFLVSGKVCILRGNFF